MQVNFKHIRLYDESDESDLDEAARDEMAREKEAMKKEMDTLKSQFKAVVAREYPENARDQVEAVKELNLWLEYKPEGAQLEALTTFDPRKFWDDFGYIIKEEKMVHLPRLKELSAFLRAVASSGTAERSFKVASDLWTKRRNSLKKPTLEKLIYVYFNRLHTSLTGCVSLSTDG